MGLLDILSSIRERADKFLNEKNVVTDFLGKVEEKTGIKKKIIAVGRLLSARFIVTTFWVILSSFSSYYVQICSFLLHVHGQLKRIQLILL